jgi:very-short-patch-repair endonuclease
MSRVRRTISPHAAPLRSASTDAEQKLWAALRGRRFLATKFRRQHSIGPYIADFACVAAHLVIELDGGQHADAITYDERRSAFMAERGWRILRFWNAEVLTNIDGVLRMIEHALPPDGDRHPHPGPAL